MRKRLAALIRTSVAVSAAFVAVRGSGHAQQVPPSNDNFDRSSVVQLGFSPPFGGYQSIVQTSGATLEPGEPTCVPDGGATVWYVYFPEASGNLLVDTAGSDFATFVAVYRITGMAPSPPGGSLEELTCTGGAASQAQLEFAARRGEGGYAIQIGGVAGETGRLMLRVSCAPGECAPPNDEIAIATRVSQMPFAESTDTTAATVEPGEPQPCGDIGRTVWYRFDTSETGGDAISVGITSASFDPVIGLYTVDYSVAPSPPGALKDVACFVSPIGTGSVTHAFTTQPFTSYYMQVGGAASAGDAVYVALTCTPGSGAAPCFFGAVIGPDTGDDDGGPIPAPGIVGPPDTGSGGYLPGSH